MKREHFGACNVLVRKANRPLGFQWSGSYPTMEGAIDELDPFQGFDLVGACGKGPSDEWIASADGFARRTQSE